MIVAIFVIGIIGNITSLLIFTSPIKTFWGIVKKKSSENYSEIPYVTTLMCTSLWTFYGIIKPDKPISTVNGVGVIFQLVYVSIFFIYAPKPKKMKIATLVTSLNVAFVGSVIALTRIAIIPEKKIGFVGLVCSILTIVMYASPLSAMSMVVKMKSVEYMPFLLSFFMFLNAVVWTIYALLIKDIFVLVPNVIGLLLGSAQLLLYFMYKNRSKRTTRSIEEEGSATLVKETELKEKPNPILTTVLSLPKPLVNRVNAVTAKDLYDLDAALVIENGKA